MSKQEYHIDGVKVILQYNSMYINGKNMDWSNADLSKVPEKFYPSEKREDLKRFASYLVDTEQYVCGKCGNIYPNTEGGTYPFSGVMCQICLDDKNHCPDNDEHDFKCTNPHQKNNARVDTKYKCKHCGKKKISPATG